MQILQVCIGRMGAEATVLRQEAVWSGRFLAEGDGWYASGGGHCAHQRQPGLV